MISELAIYNLQSARARVVLRVSGHIEAPNWTPDGDDLIVNGHGALYFVPISSPELIAIDTGSLSSLNNDHGVSPDGRHFALSDRPENGAAQIYVMEVGTTAPQLIVENAPAYWHGWSPDGETLAYVANRGEGYQVYTKPMTGGEEVQLTRGFTHCDGPDYAADGRWIWFNGEKDGSVDLWRVAATGGTPVRMTHDAAVNWFPHPSPDGQHVVYLSYQPGTKGHPALKNVELRLMPQDGGPSRRLISLLGGQGTINVPSWSPDAEEFAFMRYFEAD